MTFPPLFEGPASTLFLRHREEIRVISAGGEEAVVLLPELLAFLLHLTVHHAALVALAGKTDRIVPRLRALLAAPHG